MFSQTSQPCQFERDCAVVMIPSGDEVTLPVGTIGYITQSLGGSFTVFVDGNLFRVAGIDADAIGKEPVLPPSLPEDATIDDVEKLVWSQIKTCYDPEIPVDIYELGLIYEVEVREEDLVYVKMTLTSPMCPVAEILPVEVQEKVRSVPGVSDCELDLVWDPPWGMEMMSEAAKLELNF